MGVAVNTRPARGTPSASRRPNPDVHAEGGAVQTSTHSIWTGVLGGPFELADPQLAAVVADVESELLPDDVIFDDSGSALRWPGDELSHSPMFTDVRQVEVPRRLELLPEEYIGHLGTVSAFLTLAEPDRRLAFAEIRAVLPQRVAITADVTVHLARLR